MHLKTELGSARPRSQHTSPLCNAESTHPTDVPFILQRRIPLSTSSMTAWRNCQLERGDGHRSREIPEHRMERGGMPGAFGKPSACGLRSMGEKTCGCLALALNDGLANPQPSAPTANGTSGRIIRSKE